MNAGLKRSSCSFHVVFKPIPCPPQEEGNRIGCAARLLAVLKLLSRRCSYTLAPLAGCSRFRSEYNMESAGAYAERPLLRAGGSRQESVIPRHYAVQKNSADMLGGILKGIVRFGG